MASDHETANHQPGGSGAHMFWVRVAYLRAYRSGSSGGGTSNSSTAMTMK